MQQDTVVTIARAPLHRGVSEVTRLFAIGELNGSADYEFATRAQREPSVLWKAAGAPDRNMRILSYDDSFLFAGRDYGDSRDFGGPTEPGLFVHSKDKGRWIQITAISTVNGRFGKSSPDMLVAVLWDHTPLALQPYAEQPLRSSGSIMFPDSIAFDARSGRYELRFATSWGNPSVETVLYVYREDLTKAFESSR